MNKIAIISGMDERMYGWKDRWMVGWMDRRMVVGWIEWMDGLMGG